MVNVGLALIILLAVLVLTLRVESLDVEYYQGGLSHTELRNKRPRDCAEVSGTQGKDAVSGVYRIYPYPIGLDVFNQDGVNVYCDQSTDGGGWTIFQKRMDKTDFERNWTNYAIGFGDPLGSYWLGLNTISEMTKDGDYSLRIDMEDWQGEVRVANYRYFRVGNACEKFRLYVHDYIGTAGDSLKEHDGIVFSTIDQDNDIYSGSCAKVMNGAWWYHQCHLSNLNGKYLSDNNGSHSTFANGVNWGTWRGMHHSLKRVEMKIRKRCFGAR